MKYPFDLQIRILLPDEWEQIRETYEREFENAMPTNPAQSLFYGVFLGGQLVGFSHLETVLHLNAVYIKPENRKGRIFDAVFRAMDEAIPPDFPVIILRDKPLARLMQMYKYRNLGELSVFRKDY